MGWRCAEAGLSLAIGRAPCWAWGLHIAAGQHGYGSRSSWPGAAGGIQLAFLPFVDARRGERRRRKRRRRRRGRANAHNLLGSAAEQRNPASESKPFPPRKIDRRRRRLRN